MNQRRIQKHPILEIPKKERVSFTWNGEVLAGYEGEMIASALMANDIHIFGHHPKDNSPQGMFCANGQCSQCMVIGRRAAGQGVHDPTSRWGGREKPGRPARASPGRPGPRS
jgi:hypothetical protein